MIPDTVSSLEIVRALVAAFGLTVSWRGRALAARQRAAIERDPSPDTHIRREREQRDDRMQLYEMAQTAFCAVHAMLLGNVLINMAYPSASIEQPNVMSSNVVQILIPLILARVSEHVSLKIKTAGRLSKVTGPRNVIGEHAP